MEFVQEHHYLSLRRAFIQISALLDIKLFLTTSRDIAKKRRMESQEYKDLSKGGSRTPGQMWKTEGYFEDVAWKNHVLAHDWIVGWNGRPKKHKDVIRMVTEADVEVRDEVDAGLEDTVAWAVGVILRQLEEKEHGARNIGRG